MKRDVALSAGILTGPFVWLLSLETSFALAPVTCSTNSKAWVYAVSIVALATTTASGFMSWSQWRQTPAIPADEARASIERGRSMAIGGMAMSSLFFLVILAQSIPNFLLKGCE